MDKIRTLKAETPQSKFFGYLQALLSYTKLAHWKASGPSSYAKHIALGDLYDELPDLIDDLVETYQGLYGIINIVQPQVTVYEDAIEYLTEIFSWIEKSRSCFKESFLQNQIDTIQQHIAKALYKLKNLK